MEKEMELSPGRSQGQLEVRWLPLGAVIVGNVVVE